MCEYCDKRASNKIIKDIDEDETELMQVVNFKDNNMLYVEIDGEDNDGYKPSDFFSINYCPMCGRKLGE